MLVKIIRNAGEKFELDTYFMSLKAKIALYCLLIIGIIIGCGNENVTDTSKNQLPNIPSDPSPSTGTINVETNPQLTWQCSDPDGDSLIYDIYFGISLDLSLLDSNLTQNTYTPGQLDEKVTYYWKIVAKDIYNDTTAGPIWHFSTYGNLPPTVPSDPNPPDGAANQDTSIQLTWQCSDPEDDILTYDIYFGIDSIPPLFDSNLVFKYYSIGPLQYYTPFYWKIIAHDSHQHQTEGPIWSFRTRPEPDSIIHIDITDTPGNAHGVFISGSYAYIADGNFGLQIIYIDLTDTLNISIVGDIDTPDYASDIYVSENYAYLANGNSGLQIIDILDPSSPSIKGDYDTPGFAYDIFVSNNYAYIADGDSGLQIIDVSNPSSPSFEGNYDTPGNAQGIFVAGDYAYVADYNFGLQIIDISNPSNPTFEGSYEEMEEASSVFVSGDYAYVADGYTGGLQIINVINPSSPTYESSYNTPGTAWDIYVSGIYAYVADFNEGLQILNIYEPASPVLVADYLTAGYAYGVFVSGGYIYIACHDAGLQILQFY